MITGVIISDACFQDLRLAMCDLFYQVKNAHPHAVALTLAHSALRYNIDKTLLDYQLIPEHDSIFKIWMIVVHRFKFANQSPDFLVKIQRQLPLNLKSIFGLDVSKIINLSASADVFRPKETQLTKSPIVYYR